MMPVNDSAAMNIETNLTTKSDWRKDTSNALERAKEGVSLFALVNYRAKGSHQPKFENKQDYPFGF